MLLIKCPYCGDRPEIEFRHGGEAHLTRAPLDASDLQWSQYLYFRSNTRGRFSERWRHSHGCGKFFNAIRDTVSDQFVCTYRVDEAPPQLLSADQ